MRTQLAYCLIAGALLAAPACDKAELPGEGRGFMKSVDHVKRAVTDQVESAKQTLDVAGSVQIQLDSPLVAAGCYGKLLALGDGRPSVFTVTSYNSASNESFPSFMLQAQTQAAGGEALVGTPLEAVAFVQEAKDGAVWQSPPDRPVQVKLSAAADGALAGEASGVLVNVESSAEKPFSATFSGSFSAGAP